MAQQSAAEGMGRTTIQVSDELADTLHDMKDRGESYEDVIWTLLDDDSETDDAVLNGSPPEEPKPETVDMSEDVELPDSMPQTVSETEAREAISAALRLIGSEPCEFSWIAEEVGREYPLGYDVTQIEKRDGSWWDRIVKPGIKANGAEHQPGRGWSRNG